MCSCNFLNSLDYNQKCMFGYRSGYKNYDIAPRSLQNRIVHTFLSKNPYRHNYTVLRIDCYNNLHILYRNLLNNLHHNFQNNHQYSCQNSYCCRI